MIIRLLLLLCLLVPGVAFAGDPGAGCAGGYNCDIDMAPNLTSSIAGDSSTTVQAGSAAYLHGYVFNGGPDAGYAAASTGSIEVSNGSYVYDYRYFGTAAGAFGTLADYAEWYTFPSAGTYYYRFCADVYGQVAEMIESDNCTGWQAVTVSAATPPVVSGHAASCNAAGTQATLSWSASSGATGYYVRVYKGGQSCPSGWAQAGWDVNYCTPSPDWVTGTSVAYPTQSGSTYQWGIHSANGAGYSAYTTGPNFSCTITAPQCSDSINNDGDAWTDYPNDPGCTSVSDETESPNPQCSDGVDNDGDGLTDTNDPGCDGTGDDSESPNPQCSDGVNNDGSEDASVDYPNDPGCASASDTSESPNPAAGPPVASIDADPTRVNQGDSSDISWSASNVATSCTVTGSDGYTSGAIAGPTIATTTVARTITTQTTFRITCDGVADDEDVVVVNVSPNIEEF